MGCMMVFRAWAATGNFVDFLCRNKAIKTYCLDIGFCLYLKQFCQISEKIRENWDSSFITILFQLNTICDKLQFDTFKFIWNRENHGLDRDLYCFHNCLKSMLYEASFYPALFPIFHQREMLDQAVTERNPHTPSQRAAAVMLNSVETWVPVGLPNTYKAWRTWVLQ